MDWIESVRSRGRSADDETANVISAGYIFDRSSIKSWLRFQKQDARPRRKANQHVQRGQRAHHASKLSEGTTSTGSGLCAAIGNKNRPGNPSSGPNEAEHEGPATPEISTRPPPRNARHTRRRELSSAGSARETMFVGASLAEVQSALRGTILGFMVEACKELRARWQLARSGEPEYAYDPATSGLITDMATALVQRGQDSAGNFQTLGLQLLAAWLEDPRNREEAVRASLWSAVHQVIIESAESRGHNPEVAAAGCSIIRSLVSVPPGAASAPPRVPVQVVRTIAYSLHFHPTNGQVVRAARDALHAIPAETWRKWEAEPRQCACATFLCVLRRALLDNGSGLFGDLELLGSVLDAALVPLELHEGLKVAKTWMELGMGTLAEQGDSSGRLTAVSLRLINNYLLRLPSSAPLDGTLPAHPQALLEVRDIAWIHVRNPTVVLEVCIYLQALARRQRHAVDLRRMGFLQVLRHILDVHNRRTTPARAAVLFEASRAVTDLLQNSRAAPGVSERCGARPSWQEEREADNEANPEPEVSEEEEEEEEEEEDQGQPEDTSEEEDLSGEEDTANTTQVEYDAARSIRRHEGHVDSELERALGAVMDRMHGMYGAQGFRCVVFEAAKRAMEANRQGAGLSRSILLHREGWVGIGVEAAALAVGAVSLECLRLQLQSPRPQGLRLKATRRRQRGVMIDVGAAAFYDLSGRAVVGVQAPVAIGLVLASQEEADAILKFFGAATLLILLLRAAKATL